MPLACCCWGCWPNKLPACCCCGCWTGCPNRLPVCCGCCCCWGCWPNRPPGCCCCCCCAAGFWAGAEPKRPPVCWGWAGVVPNKEPVCAGWEAAVPKSPPPAGGWLGVVVPLCETDQFNCFAVLDCRRKTHKRLPEPVLMLSAPGPLADRAKAMSEKKCVASDGKQLRPECEAAGNCRWSERVPVACVLYGCGGLFLPHRVACRLSLALVALTGVRVSRSSHRLPKQPKLGWIVLGPPCSFDWIVPRLPLQHRRGSPISFPISRPSLSRL